MTQVEAINEALEGLEQGGIVHVFGLMDDSGLHPRARRCDAVDRGEPVVYHVAPEKVSGLFFCLFCGEAEGQDN